jgi:hypothetical protein
MNRRRKSGSRPVPPELAKAWEPFLAKYFPKGLSLKPDPAWQSNEITKFLARQCLGPRPSPKPTPAPPSNPKPGSAAAWIDEVCPNGEWRLMTGKQVHGEIVREAEKRKPKKWPSYSAVMTELRKRRQQKMQKKQK